MGFRVPRARACPACGSVRIKLSHSRGLERMLWRMVARPYRCEQCRARFWRMRTPSPLLITAIGGLVLSIVLFLLIVWILDQLP
jgi:hypothetical protein